MERFDELHSITTRQGIKQRGAAHQARVVADYGAAMRGTQGWMCIKWPTAQHGGVEGVQADELYGSVGGGCTI